MEPVREKLKQHNSMKTRTIDINRIQKYWLICLLAFIPTIELLGWWSALRAAPLGTSVVIRRANDICLDAAIKDIQRTTIMGFTLLGKNILIFDKSIQVEKESSVSKPLRFFRGQDIESVAIARFIQFTFERIRFCLWRYWFCLHISGRSAVDRIIGFVMVGSHKPRGAFLDPARAAPIIPKLKFDRLRNTWCTGNSFRVNLSKQHPSAFGPNQNVSAFLGGHGGLPGGLCLLLNSSQGEYGHDDANDTCDKQSDIREIFRRKQASEVVWRVTLGPIALALGCLLIYRCDRYRRSLRWLVYILGTVLIAGGLGAFCAPMYWQENHREYESRDHAVFHSAENISQSARVI
jgi:hypothetical protein